MIMEYKGFHSVVCYDEDDDIYYGHIDHIVEGVSFHADEIEDLEIAFREAIDDYLDTLTKIGKTNDTSS